jgi:hypothetical protein
MTTHGDMIYALGGVPVMGGGSRYYGWWGKSIYFVDFDSGSDDNDGLTIDNPKKDLRKLLFTTGGAGIAAQSTVYIKNRPMASTATNDAQYIDSQSSSGQFFIAPESSYVSIIGAAPQMISAQGGYYTYLRGSTSCTTGPVLGIMSYGCAVENIAFHRGGITSGSAWTGGMVGLFGSTQGCSHLAKTQGRATACQINNCLFRWTAPGPDSAAILNMDGWYHQITNCHFYNCQRGIHMRGVQSSSPRECGVINNTFSGSAGSWSYNILMYSSNMRGNIIHGNIFSHPAPTGTTGSATGDHITFIGSDTGSIVSGNYCTDSDMTGEYTLITNVLAAGNYDSTCDTVGG